MTLIKNQAKIMVWGRDRPTYLSYVFVRIVMNVFQQVGLLELRNLFIYLRYVVN